MEDKSIAAKAVLTALFIAIAIWSTLGSPPHHTEITKREFAGPP
jgi:hypothetical protein